MYSISKNVVTHHINLNYKNFVLLHYHQHNSSRGVVCVLLTHSDSGYDRRHKHWHHHPAGHSQVVFTSWDIVFLTATMDLQGEQQALLQTTCEEHGCMELGGTADCLLPCDPCRLGSPQWWPGWRGPLWGRWPPVLRATCPPATEPCGFATMASCPRRYILRDWDAQQAVSFAPRRENPAQLASSNTWGSARRWSPACTASRTDRHTRCSSCGCSCHRWSSWCRRRSEGTAWSPLHLQQHRQRVTHDHVFIQQTRTHRASFINLLHESAQI